MNQQTCNRAWLDAFLNNNLNESEEHWLTSHLDECSDCREELESRAAEQSVWLEASNLLGGSKLHSTAAIGDHRSAVHSPQIALVLQQLAPTDDPDSLGRIGGYEVTGVVGAGGMGVVLKAHDRSLERIVAVKVMSPHLASSGSARKRFAREAKAAAAVLHPNVIAIHSVASEDANPYLVMPFVRGASLQKRIDSQGPLPLKDTLRIGAQIAAGLAAAHEQGLVHRDIKPANILLEEGVERVTITDFGLARAVDDASMTCSGVIAGTPQYMSPEQARGEPIDARSDLFSLGGVLFAMCTGRSPFRAETTYGVLHRIANDKPTSVCEINTDVPVWLGQVIERLMAKRPDDRFESAAHVAELLEGCLAHVQQPAAIPLPDAVTALAPKKTRRPPIGKFIAAAAFAFAIIFAGVLIMLELDKGTLTIESEMQNVPIRIMQGDTIVERLTVSQSGKAVRVAAGTYVVELETKLDGIIVENDRVSLKRGTTEHVMIRLSKQAANAAVGLHNQPAIENTDSTVSLPPSDTKPKIIVILCGGRNVLAQINASGKNKHVKLLEDLHAIGGVEVNFRYREGDLSNEFSQAFVRDSAGLMNQEALATGKPSARRDALNKALAQIPIVGWEDGVVGFSLQSNQPPADKHQNYASHARDLDSTNENATVPLTRYSIEANTTGYGHAPQVGSRIDLLVNIHVPDPTDPEVRPVVRNALVTATHDSGQDVTVSRDVTIELQLTDAEIQLIKSYEPLHAFTFRPVDQKTTLKTRATDDAGEHRNARSVVEAYVAAALAGDVAKAAALSKNSPADPKRIQELPEFLNVQRLKIETVTINDPAKPTQALATSVAVKLDEEHKNPDGRRDGYLVFTLEFTDDKWFVIDIDFESESGAEKELNKFLKANPSSIGIPPQSQNLPQ